MTTLSDGRRRAGAAQSVGLCRAGAAALAVAVAVLAGADPAPVKAAPPQQRPESILPPGFGQSGGQSGGQPGPTPRATTPPRSAPTARPSAVATPRAGVPTGIPTPSTATAVVQPLPTPSAEPSATPSPTPTIDAATLAFYQLPPASRRSLALVGPVADQSIAPDAFGRADGPMLERLMRRLSTPLPSRWLAITLRRLLAAQLQTPARVNGADFAAERAWLLLRMGEADAARAIVQGVDDGNYTPKLYQVALNAMLAAADPAGLCPLADGGLAATGERGWRLAQAMCAGLAGDPARATALMADARKRRVASGVDLTLAQKVMGAGPGGRQAVTVEWDGVDRLTAWRFGLAAATGATLPDPLLAGAAPQVRDWRATAAAVPLGDRIASADEAARRGILSSAALVDLYGAVAAMDDPPAAANGVADDLHTAYVGGKADDRATALRRLWGEDGKPPAYERLILTARAAARVVPGGGSPDADRLVAAMLTAGLDHTAARWRPYVETGSDAWAMLALADPTARRLGYRDLSSYAGAGDVALKRRLLFAGLAGLGRLEPADVERAAQALDVRIGAENSWTRALDQAARDGQAGTVVLLAATGMQTPAWSGVPPVMLYRIVGALRAVGLTGEARMIAAEAIARA